MNRRDENGWRAYCDCRWSGRQNGRRRNGRPHHGPGPQRSGVKRRSATRHGKSRKNALHDRTLSKMVFLIAAEPAPADSSFISLYGEIGGCYNAAKEKPERGRNSGKMHGRRVRELEGAAGPNPGQPGQPLAGRGHPGSGLTVSIPASDRLQTCPTEVPPEGLRCPRPALRWPPGHSSAAARWHRSARRLWVRAWTRRVSPRHPCRMRRIAAR